MALQEAQRLAAAWWGYRALAWADAARSPTIAWEGAPAEFPPGMPVCFVLPATPFHAGLPRFLSGAGATQRTFLVSLGTPLLAVPDAPPGAVWIPVIVRRPRLEALVVEALPPLPREEVPAWARRVVAQNPALHDWEADHSTIVEI